MAQMSQADLGVLATLTETGEMRSVLEDKKFSLA
jgi:hypothetical protein